MAKEDIYYIPSIEDHKYNDRYYSTMFGRKKKLYYTDNMPTNPIDPTFLAKQVIVYLEKYGNVICEEAEDQVKSFCRLFNYCILDNSQKNTESTTSTRFVHSAQTGSAKSLSLKVYIANLIEHSSLVVVSKVEEALEFCKAVNEISDNPNYARCFYSITDKNHNSELRVDSGKLKEYRCIVISHAMFQNLNYSDNLDTFKIFSKKQRDLVVIDEKINFYKTTVLTKKEIDNIYIELLMFIEYYKLDEKYKESTNLLGLIIHVMKEDLEKDQVPFNFLDMDTLLKKEELQKALLYLSLLLELKIENLFTQLRNIANVNSQVQKNNALTNAKQFIEKLGILLNNDDIDSGTYYYKGNTEQILFKVENIVNKLGSCVILDATANVNEFYNVAHLYDRLLLDVYAKPIRKYSNLTFHKAKGFRQGRSSTFRISNSSEVELNAKRYLSYAASVLSSSKDKLLIITHKGFKLALEKQCNDPRIRFTHWGNHIGKNDWNDCNKVFVVGWNFIPNIEHIYSAFNAIGNEEISFTGITDEIISKFASTQLADDIIQGVMRSQARKIDTKDGDCKPTDVYLFYEDIKQYNDVINIVVEQFPYSKVLDWVPIGIARKTKRTSRTKNSDVVISYLDQVSSTSNDITLKEVREELKLKPYQMSRIINSDYFKEQLEKKGYKQKNSDGKSIYYILS